ncbi:MAG: hypothetical protein U0324_36850 [Polyangiales bacterium]
MSVRPLTYRDIQATLARLGDTTAGIVQVGGKALNFWAEHYMSRAPALAASAPYASKDVDFCGDRAAVIECARRLGGRARLPVDVRFGGDPFDAVVRDARLPAAFRETRYPQMVARLVARRRAPSAGG